MIRLFDVRSTRQLISRYQPGASLPDGTYAAGTDAVYDHPHRKPADVVADFLAGRPTPGDEITVCTLGAGTTVRVETAYLSLGWDDGVNVTSAVYRDEAGAWQRVRVWDDYGGGDRLNEAVVDAAPDVFAAYNAHLRGQDEAAAVRLAQIARQQEADRQLAERAAPRRGRFVIVTQRGERQGAVGRVFYENQQGRIGVALSGRTERKTLASGRSADVAADVFWGYASHAEALLVAAPDAELPLLYRAASAVLAHAHDGLSRAAGAGRGSRSKARAVDAFTALWRWAVERPERLAVMLAYGPADLPRLDAETPRTLREVCEAVETMPDVARRLARLPTEWPAAFPAGDGAAAARAELAGAIRAEVAGTLGDVWEPTTPAKKRARKRSAPKAAGGAPATMESTGG